MKGGGAIKMFLWMKQSWHCFVIGWIWCQNVDIIENCNSYELIKHYFNTDQSSIILTTKAF